MIGLFNDAGERLPITYNGFALHSAVDPAESVYHIDLITPATQFDYISESNQQRDGVEVYEARKVSRIIRLDGTIRAQSIAMLFDKMRLLAAAFDPAKLSYEDTTTLGFRALDFSTPTEDTAAYPAGYVPSRYYCRALRTPEPSVTDYTGLSAVFAIELLLRDPRRYAQALTTSALGVITNTGDYRSWPTVTITMTGAGSATYAVTNTGAFRTRTVTLNLSGTINGDVITIDNEKREIRKNGVLTQSLYVSGQYFEIDPGTNTVSVANGTNATTSVSWRKAWSY